MKRLFLGLIAATVLGGCFVGTSSTSDGTNVYPPPGKTAPVLPTSSAITTRQMRASLSAQSDGQSIKIYAGVFYSDQAIVLEKGDYFTAQLPGAEAIVLTREQGTKDDVAHYSGTLPEQTEAVDVIIALNRNPGWVSAPSSKIHLPAPFQITSTAPPTAHRGDSLPIQITPAPTSKVLGLNVDGDCLDKTRSELISVIGGFDADGKTSFDTSHLYLASNSSSCAISLSVRVETSGELDPAFGGGVSGSLDGADDSEGLQERSFGTTLIP